MSIDENSVKHEEGGLLEGADLKVLAEQAKTETPGMAIGEDPSTADPMISWGEETPTAETPKQEIATPAVPAQPNVGGGVIVDNPKPQQQGVVVGPMAGAGNEHVDAMNAKLKEFNDMIEIGRKVALAKGEKLPELPTYVQIMIDKLGWDKVEFTEDEKAKMAVAKQIKVVTVETKEL